MLRRELTAIAMVQMTACRLCESKSKIAMELAPLRLAKRGFNGIYEYNGESIDFNCAELEFDGGDCDAPLTDSTDGYTVDEIVMMKIRH